MSQGTDLATLAQQLLGYAHQGNWRMLVAIALSGVVWLLRTFLMGPKVQGVKYVGAIARWFHTDRGGVVLTLIVGVLGGFATAFKASAPLTIDLFVTGVVNGLLAAGFFVGLKKLVGLGGGASPADSSVLRPKAVNSDRPQPPAASSSGMLKKVSVALVCTAIAGALVPACYCMRPENANKPECIAAQQEIDCAKDDIKQMLPKFMPLVAWLFAGAQGPIDSQSLISALEQTGLKFVGCSAAELEQDFTVDPSGTQAMVLSKLPGPVKATLPGDRTEKPLDAHFHERYRAWRAKYPALAFCFNQGGRKVCR